MKIRFMMIMMSSVLLGAQALAGAAWDSYFPTDKPQSAKIMDIKVSPELQHISLKFQAAIKQNQAWFLEYVKQAPQGQALPYDKRMGITEKEYQQVLAVAHQKFVPVGSIEVSFKKIDADHIKITTATDSPINGLVVSANEVTTPLEKLTTKSAVNNTNADSPTGAWEGLQWRFQKAAAATMKFTDIKLAVGKLKTSGENILYYNVKDVDHATKKNTHISFAIYY